MTIDDGIAALGLDDQLSLFVGRVARTNALLEFDLGNVWHILGGEPHPAGVGIEQLAVDCRRLLRKTHIDQGLVDAGLSSIDAARKANSVRNRIVHDLWLEDTSSANRDGGFWQAFRLTSGQLEPAVATNAVTLDIVVEADDSLRRARTRVSGLFMALNELASHKPPTRVQSSEAIDMSRYLAMMNDHFELHHNGDIEISEEGRSARLRSENLRRRTDLDRQRCIDARWKSRIRIGDGTSLPLADRVVVHRG